MAVQHDIETNGARPVLCGPRRLAPAGLRTEQICIKDMLERGQIESSDSPWASPVVLVTKKDGSMRFCADYRRLNSSFTPVAVMACWLVGTYSSDSSRFLLNNIERGLSTLRHMTCLVNVVNVYDRIVRCRHQTWVLVNPNQRRPC